MSSGRKAGGQQALRAVLRILGPAMVVLGLAFIGLSAIEFFSGREPPKISDLQTGTKVEQKPQYLWARWVGIPLVLVGIVVTSMAFDRLFAGAKDDDEADEIAPRRSMDQPLGQWSAQRTRKPGSSKGKGKR